MPPEIVLNKGHSFEVDFYCLGILIFELLMGYPPFYDPDSIESETKARIIYGEVEFPDDCDLSENVKDLILKLLEKNPIKRIGHFAGAK